MFTVPEMSGSSSMSSARSSSESSAVDVHPDIPAMEISDSSDISSDDESSSSVEIIVDEPQCTSMKTKTRRGESFELGFKHVLCRSATGLGSMHFDGSFS